MLAFRDFVPKQTKKPGLIKEAEYESFEAAVAAAGEWLKQSGVRPLQIETVVLPSIWEPKEQGSQDSSLRMVGEFNTYWHQFIRVWYDTELPTPYR